jgi:hypothetical protein
MVFDPVKGVDKDLFSFAAYQAKSYVKNMRTYTFLFRN